MLEAFKQLNGESLRLPKRVKDRSDRDRLRYGSSGSRRWLRMPAFTRSVGIDYSRAQLPTASVKGLRVCLVEGA